MTTDERLERMRDLWNQFQGCAPASDEMQLIANQIDELLGIERPDVRVEVNGFVRRLLRAVFAVLLFVSTPAWGAITFVGETTASLAAGGGPTNVTLPTTLENDIVIVIAACDFGMDVEGVLDGSWTDIAHPTSSAPGHQIAYKIMGATPDTTVEMTHEASRDIAVLIQAFRGVDTSTPLDTTSTNASSGGGDPDSPSITTVTNGAWVITTGHVDDDSPVTITTVPSGYSNSGVMDTNDEASNAGAGVVMASKEVASAGAEDPAGWDLTTADGWEAYSIALRPAGAAGGRTRRTF